MDRYLPTHFCVHVLCGSWEPYLLHIKLFIPILVAIEIQYSHGEASYVTMATALYDMHLLID